jgi:hypothetical protein
MPPDRLLLWERLLQSPVAALLLLLVGYGVLGRVIWVLWRRNQEQQEAIVRLLSANNHFGTAITHVHDLVTLAQTLAHAPDPSAPRD